MNLLVFGATGYCGRAVVEQSLDYEKAEHGGIEKVVVFVRSQSKAKSMFAKCGEQQKKLVYYEGDIYQKNDIQEAIQKYSITAIISCLSSYKRPHDQMSSFTRNLIEAVSSPEIYGSTASKRLPFIHFGYPRGYPPDGTGAERILLKLTEIISFSKYGPAIRDHLRVKELLLKEESSSSRLEYSLFAAPNMVNRPGRQKSFVGGPGTVPVEEAIAKSRVWHSVSTFDAADLMLSHLLYITKEEGDSSASSLPKLLCLAYE